MTDPARAWDDHADTYASLFAPLTGYIAKAMLTTAETRLRPGAKILDVACGSGALAVPAAERAARLAAAGGPRGHVRATDFSQKMVELTGAALAGRGIPGDLYACEVQNGEALTFADASFDAVFSCFGIFLFADRHAGFREAARVLAKGGVFATTVWHGPETNAMLRHQITAIAAALPEALRPTQPAPWMEIATADALQREIEATGAFRDVLVRPFQASLVLCPWQAGWDSLRQNPVMGQLLAKCSPEELERVRVGFFDAFRALAGGDDAPLVLDSTCNILVATRA